MSGIFVVTGGPCTGKTTTILQLEQRGFVVAHEEAAKLIKEGSVSLESDWFGFQRELVRRQLEAEAELLKLGKPIVADRGVFDNIAYCVKKGRGIPEFLLNVAGPRYQMAFLMEPLGFWKDDGIRSEDLAFTEKITPLLEQAYVERGVPVVRVPSMTPDERTEFILSQAGLVIPAR